MGREESTGIGMNVWTARHFVAKYLYNDNVGSVEVLKHRLYCLQSASSNNRPCSRAVMPTAQWPRLNWCAAARRLNEDHSYCPLSVLWVWASSVAVSSYISSARVYLIIIGLITFYNTVIFLINNIKNKGLVVFSAKN